MNNVTVTFTDAQARELAHALGLREDWLRHTALYCGYSPDEVAESLQHCRRALEALEAARSPLPADPYPCARGDAVGA